MQEAGSTDWATTELEVKDKRVFRQQASVPSLAVIPCDYNMSHNS